MTLAQAAGGALLLLAMVLGVRGTSRLRTRRAAVIMELRVLLGPAPTADERSDASEIEPAAAADAAQPPSASHLQGRAR